MPIGVFARRSGLTSSALRFYADSGLLRPAEVDPASGYRYYRADQLPRATALRRLREIAMPLVTVAAVLDGDPGEAARLIDGHVAEILGDAAGARQKAVMARSALVNEPALPVATLVGPVFADAIEQILTATAREPDLPVLGGVLIEARPEAITLTATDRYRLSTRSLVPAEQSAMTWSATVDGDELRSAAGEIRRGSRIRIEATPHGVWLRNSDREDRYCRILDAEFPEYRRLLASLGEVTTRASIAKEPLLRALEEGSGEHVTLDVTGAGVRVDGVRLVPGRADGPDLRISFALTTFYPAVSTAIGPDVLLDLRGPDLPVTVRSADRGDLTTVAMPVKGDPS